MKKVRRSLLFFGTGILFILVPFIHEILSVPWASLGDENVNETVMREPVPLSVEYINYEDIVRQVEETEEVDESEAVRETPRSATRPVPDETPASGLPVILPGEETPVSVPADTPAAVPEQPKYVRLGAVKIPRINISENLIEGATNNSFNYGIGHADGTAMPGEEGNSVIAAHRVSSIGMEPFRYLDAVKNGDIITVDFNQKTYTYEVYESFIVSKYDVWVMEPVEEETHVLTLVTCDPVIYPGNRPDRLIVRAKLRRLRIK